MAVQSEGGLRPARKLSFPSGTAAALTLVLCLICGNAPAAGKTQARLVLSAQEARAGESIMAGIQLRMDPNWHTYWKNGGDSGIATKVQWILPDGVTAGEIQWPVPEKLTVKTGDSSLTTYIYHKEVVLLVPLKLPDILPAGSLAITGKVSWLECELICVPGKAEVSAQLTIGTTTTASAEAALLDEWKKRLPSSEPITGTTGMWETASTGEIRPLVIDSDLKDLTDFFPYGSDAYEVQGLTDILTNASGGVRLRKNVRKLSGEWPAQVAGLLVRHAGAAPASAIEANLPIAGGGKAAAQALVATVKAPAAPLGTMLGFAFLGGMILNIMPCVFPVIAIKIFGFVQQGREDPKRVFTLGLIYALGVLASFLVMAGLVIAVKQAGGSASWGMQLQSPQFCVGLAVLVTLVGLNLFGVFEVNLGGRTMSAAGQLASKHGAPGAFFNGVLTTLLATPCTAPFLAPALGFAFVQPPLIIVLFFIAIGLGLAAPYVVLSAKTGWLKLLPRPGAWMEKFKVAMGFPMLATAVWVFWFTAPRFGDAGVLWVGLFLVVVAFAAWIWGEFVQRGSKRRGLAIFICAGLVGGMYVLALEKQLHWRSPTRSGAGEIAQEPGGIAWRAWSVEAVEQARKEGRIVLVDFTAKWCLTCNTIVKPALESDAVRKKITELNVVALLADNTDFPPAIVAELQKFGRAGVPLVLVYPRDSKAPAMILPDGLLTPQIVADALTEAAK